MTIKHDRDELQDELTLHFDGAMKGLCESFGVNVHWSIIHGAAETAAESIIETFFDDMEDDDE